MIYFMQTNHKFELIQLIKLITEQLMLETLIKIFEELLQNKSNCTV